MSLENRPRLCKQLTTVGQYDWLPYVQVHVEYGNELWHTGFPGGQYAQRMGLALNTTEEGARWYGERMMHGACAVAVCWCLLCLPTYRTAVQEEWHRRAGIVA